MNKLMKRRTNLSGRKTLCTVRSVYEVPSWMSIVYDGCGSTPNERLRVTAGSTLPVRRLRIYEPLR